MAMKFPCPYCKGKGGYTEVILDDGTGPHYPCGFCNDECLIEIGSELHMKLKRMKLADAMWGFVDEGYVLVDTDAKVMEIQRWVKQNQTHWDDVPH